MRIIHIDNYDVCEDNGKFLAATFTDYEGISHEVEIDKKLEEYFKEVRREEYSEEWETRFHIDVEINNKAELFEINISLKSDVRSAEDIFLENEIEKEIISEIKKLPIQQSKRVYLRIIKDCNVTEIAKLESRDKAAISRSIKSALYKIFKKI